MIETLRRAPNHLYQVLAGFIGIIFLSGFYYQGRELSQNNKVRFEQIRCVMKLTGPQDRVFDFFHGGAVYRPHAQYYWFLPEDVTFSLGREKMIQMVLATWE